MPLDPKTLPRDPETLQKMLVDVTAQLDRTERLLRQLIQAKTGRKSEQLSREQVALFAGELKMSLPEAEEPDNSEDEPPAGASASRQREPARKKTAAAAPEARTDRARSAGSRKALRRL